MILDLLFLTGCLLIAVSAFFVSLTTGLFVTGLLLIIISFMGALIYRNNEGR